MRLHSDIYLRVHVHMSVVCVCAHELVHVHSRPVTPKAWCFQVGSCQSQSLP